MNDPDVLRITRVFEAITDRTKAQGDALAAALAARWSPADRHDPLAREWLRHRHLRPAQLPPPACACATGHCLVCN
jgi:hypothetical protein